MSTGWWSGYISIKSFNSPSGKSEVAEPWPPKSQRFPDASIQLIEPYLEPGLLFGDYTFSPYIPPTLCIVIADLYCPLVGAYIYFHRSFRGPLFPVRQNSIHRLFCRILQLTPISYFRVYLQRPAHLLFHKTPLVNSVITAYPLSICFVQPGKERASKRKRLS